MIDGVLRVPGLRGLILETFGAGNAPSGEDGSLTAIFKAAVKRGIVIVNVSQCQSGSVTPLYAPGQALGNAGVVFGHDLTTEAALTKLSFLLALPEVTYTDITQQMVISIRGEMSEAASAQFSHPPSKPLQITDQQTAFTALGYAITKGDVEAVTNMLNGDLLGLLEARDYVDNTALHIAAVGPDTRVLRVLLNLGASVHARNRANNTPLFLARQVGNKEVVELLEKVGAHLHIEEVERTKKGLVVAGENGNGKRLRTETEDSAADM